MSGGAFLLSFTLVLQARLRIFPLPKKSAVDLPQFLSSPPSTSPRSRPEKKKSAVQSPQFLSTRPSTCPRFRPEKKGPRQRLRQRQRQRQRQERRTTPLRVQLAKKNQRFQFFLFLKSCILISFCVAQFVTIRMNLSGSWHKSYSRHVQYLKYLSRLQKNYHFSSAFIIDHTSI